MEWNDTTVPFRDTVCIHELFEQQAAAAPEAECLAFESTYMTFAEVNQRSNQLARHLRTLGVGRDVPVAILMERSFDLIIAMMGMLQTSTSVDLPRGCEICLACRDVLTFLSGQSPCQPIAAVQD